MIRNIDLWLKGYLTRLWQQKKDIRQQAEKPLQILFTICDHYEPFWNRVNAATAHDRVATWVDNYQAIADRHRDCLGGHPRHCFFYPEEEYQQELMEMIAEICRNGFGEVEIHLHHDNDTAENLQQTLGGFTRRLARDHGLLARCTKTQAIKYGFIHGNWALDNSRPDGRWCGVNNEIDVLLATGCYADFTMPSAPDITQTSTVNSIYYAVDDPEQPKSHDTGIPARAGVPAPPGLLCIQGPLAFNLGSRKFDIIPRIENGCLSHDAPGNATRIQLWFDQRIHVNGRADVVFVKLHTHGTQEGNMEYFFKHNGLEDLFTELEEGCARVNGRLFYVSTRQMFNVVKGLEQSPNAEVSELLDYELKISY
jgi:hypothetical protein